MIRTYDGCHLTGTMVLAAQRTAHAVVLVHGGGVTREEGGFFSRLAEGLAAAGITSLRYDLRGHGESDGPMEQATLTGHLNDIQVATDHLRAETGISRISLLGASFGGGLCAYFAAKRLDQLDRLVLLNPQLDYKDRYIDQKPHWDGNFLNDEMADRLREEGYVQHSPTVRHGRGLLNEVFWIRPVEVVGEIATPTLIVHGTNDTFVSIDASRSAVQQLRAEHRLVEIEGAQHGFAVHDDPTYRHPQTQQWQAFVIKTVTEWLALPS